MRCTFYSFEAPLHNFVSDALGDARLPVARAKPRRVRPRAPRIFGLAIVIFLILAVPRNARADDGTVVAASSNQTITGPDGVCKNVTNTSSTNALFVPTASTPEWQSFYNNPGSATVAACPSACGGSYTVSSSVNNSLYSIAGSPSCTGGTFTFTIPGGTIVGSNTTGTAALYTGAFPSGSTVNLIVNGYVEGMGGNGGLATYTAGYANANPGAPGGVALFVQYPLTISGSGAILGGGGGGSSGASWNGAGGGGGGGQGYGTSTGGRTFNYGPATDGNQAGPGLGGTSNVWGSPGANGGTWGTAGTDATDSYGSVIGTGGAAGYAIQKNGQPVSVGVATYGPVL